MLHDILSLIMVFGGLKMEQQEEILTPSYHGELCCHNGDNPDYEIACDECDFYLICFPDWKETIEMYDIDDKRKVGTVIS